MPQNPNGRGKKMTLVEGKETEYGESGTIIINSQDYT